MPPEKGSRSSGITDLVLAGLFLVLSTRPDTKYLWADIKLSLPVSRLLSSFEDGDKSAEDRRHASDQISDETTHQSRFIRDARPGAQRTQRWPMA